MSKGSDRYIIWSGVRSGLYALANALGEKSTNGALPISIRNVVEKRAALANRESPTRVVFRPLWVDGCTIVTKGGFDIYVNCEKHEISVFKEQFENENAGTWLPPRVRFTIAHEIGHTLLFDSIKGVQPKARINVDHHKVLEALEDSCDEVAGHILLPTNLLRRKAQKEDLFDPGVLRNLTQEAKVSASMLVRRVGALGELLPGSGALAYGVETANSSRIVAFAASPSLRPIFRSVSVGQSIASFVHRTTGNFALKGGKECGEIVEFSEQPEWAKKFEFRCETQSSRAGHRGFFVTARLLK